MKDKHQRKSNLFLFFYYEQSHMLSLKSTFVITEKHNTFIFIFLRVTSLLQFRRTSLILHQNSVFFNLNTVYEIELVGELVFSCDLVLLCFCELFEQLKYENFLYLISTPLH